MQYDVTPVREVHDELMRRTFSLPDVENRPTIVSLPGALGVVLEEGVEIKHPEVIPRGREFTHIHPDGSLHAPLPYLRAREAVKQGWADWHPTAHEVQGREGLVMLYTPQSIEELDVVLQLIVESYNYVTGRTVRAVDYPLGDVGVADSERTLSLPPWGKVRKGVLVPASSSAEQNIRLVSQDQ